MTDRFSDDVSRRSVIGGVVAGAAAGVRAQAGVKADTGTMFGGRRIDVRDFGARGDRQHDDGAAIASAIAVASRHDQYPASVFLPAGHYHRRDTIALKHHLSLIGEGDSSVLNSQGDTAFNRPILANSTSDGLVHARLSDLSLIGGSHGLKLQAAAENADIRLTNVGMDLQSVANIEADKLFQTVKIANCSFGRAPYGLKVNGYGTNLLLALASEWVGHEDSAIFLRGAETVTFVGNRFESGGRVGKACIDIEDANTVSFIGCWFEDTHETLGRFRAIAGQVLFQSCHFTGTKLGGTEFRGFRWDIADCRMTFRDCLSMVPMSVDGHVDLDGSIGINPVGALVRGSDRAGSITASPRTLSSNQAPLLTINPSRSEDWSVIGTLTLIVLSDTDAVIWRQDVGNINLQSRMLEHRAADSADWRVTAKPGDKGELLLDAVLPAVAKGRRLWWRFEWSAISGGVIVRAR